MNTSIIKFDYNGNQIPFEKGDDVMVNLTAMAKAYPDKNLSTIVNSQEISDYCASLSKLKNFSFADLLIVRKGAPDLGGGTWAHRLVAIRVAQKLNSDLAVWVDMRVDELLKYGMTATQPTLEQMINNPDLVISLATQLKNEREEKQRIETENLYLKEQNEAQRPAVVFTESVKVSNTNILIEDLAKLITQNGYTIGEIRLYNWLVDNGYLIRHKRWSNSRRKYENYYTPTQRAAEMKLFWVSERVISNPGQPQFTKFTCYVTGEGQVYFINKFNKLKVA
jgi:phage antirepressor YoqD-like protein|uniref:KilA-N domain-containing protein n=1 Tax=Myoviridae sp. ct9Ns12 TaxID=2826626 RepID=A0A8S5MHC7_9CAUD|nr:MAG TPA: hypothetical protein [Myoviridae sp. ct9Ns12]DAH62103.1 MAG TPA: hypothetical protein [Caudoviricetes sp.]